MAEQAYLEVTHSHDEMSRQRFEASYEKFKEIYLGLITAKKVELDAFQVNESDLPEIPGNSLLEEVTDQALLQKTDPKSLVKRLNRSYYFFNGNELTTLKFLIPEHQKNFFIPAIGGIALNILMRASLSKQMSTLKESNDTRKRTARDKFILKAKNIVLKADAIMDRDKMGGMFDVHDGFSGYSADPLVIDKEIHKECEVYKKELVIIEDCKLSGSELTHAYFERAIETLEKALTNELSDISKKYEQSKTKISFLDKIKLKLEYEYKQNQQRLKDKYHRYITEMKNFKEIVKRIGPENMMIFASEVGGKASFSVLKDALINESIASAGFSPIASH